MLKNNFFHFVKPEINGNMATGKLEIDAAHEIFNGHFPDNPVVPGVCMMQMVKEVLEHVLGSETRLVKAGEMKFLAILNPNENKHTDLQLTYTPVDQHIRVDAKIYHQEIIFFKFKGVFKPL